MACYAFWETALDELTLDFMLGGWKLKWWPSKIDPTFSGIYAAFTFEGLF